MFGLRYIKALPNNHIMQFKNGRVVRQGRGLSFFFFAPSTTLVSVPVASVDEPFIFSETTRDYQEVTIQGQVTYRIKDPEKLADMLDYTLDGKGARYHSEDPESLSGRILSIIQVRLRYHLNRLDLNVALASSEETAFETIKALTDSAELGALGIELLGLSILALKPNPETSRALEAKVRENLLREADEAAYARRNAAVEQERAIRENELNTEVAVEKKKRQVREEKIEADRSIKQKQHLIKAEDMTARTELEQSNKELVALTSENRRTKADAEAYGISCVLEAMGKTDHKTLQALASTGMNPGQLIALGFRELAESADKIGQLNISPDLLSELIRKE